MYHFISPFTPQTHLPDVITVHGTIHSAPDHAPSSLQAAAMFNLQGHLTSLPARIEHDLVDMSRAMTHHMRSYHPIVRDVVSFVRKTRSVGQSGFRCLYLVVFILFLFY